MDFPPETRLKDRYRIIQLLGRGGMGAVYLAYDTALENQVAVKVNHSPHMESTTHFMREARLLATLRHPSLPRVTDYFIIGQNQFLVMDYIPGDDLSNLLKKEGIQSVTKVLQWATQLGSALSYLHNQKPAVIHRDIKPANIKLTAEGEVTLVDFGIAKTADAQQATMTGSRSFTPGFAPPEQYGQAIRTSALSDQYSFAATLYKLLTNLDPVDSLERVMEHRPLTPIIQVNPAVPPHVQAAIEKAMSLKPDDRFASIDEFVAALMNPGFHAEATRRAPQPIDLPAPPPQPKNKAGIAVGITVGVVVLLLIIAAGGTGVFFFLKSQGLLPGMEVAQATSTQLMPTSTQLQQATPRGSTVTETSEVMLDASPSPSITPEPSKTLVPTFTSTPTSADTPTPTVTPMRIGQGGIIAFVSDRADGKTRQVWVMSVNMDSKGLLQSSDLNQITNDDSDKSQLAWSADGRYLLYVAAGTKPEYGLDVWKLDYINLDVPPVDLTQRKGDDTDPAWSPDGKTIAFVNNGREDGIHQIYFMDNNGANQKRVSFDYEEYAPVFSPDGKLLLFVVNAKSHQTIYTRKASEDFATPRPYDVTSFFGRLGNVGDIAWSPDGERLAYVEIKTHETDIFTERYSSLGGDTYQLTKDSHKETQPCWSPDSRWIIFTSERDGNLEVYIMNSTGLSLTNLSNSAGVDSDPAWQPSPPRDT